MKGRLLPSLPSRRWLLLGIIALELVASAIVLHWLLASETGEGRAVAAVPRPTSSPTVVSLAPSLPDSLVASIMAWLHDRAEPWLPGSEGAGLAVDWQSARGARPVAEMFLVPAVPLASLREDLAFDDVRRAWHGEAAGRFLVPDTAVAALDSILGPRAAQAAVEIVPAGELVPRLEQQPEATAILPFDELQPRLKPLSVDGLFILDRGLDEARWPLRAVVWAGGPAGWEEELAAALEQRGMDSNRHLDRLTVLAMTGVTAMDRGVALEIEARGVPG